MQVNIYVRNYLFQNHVRRFRMQTNSELTCVDSRLMHVILGFQIDAKSRIDARQFGIDLHPETTHVDSGSRNDVRRFRIDANSETTHNNTTMATSISDPNTITLNVGGVKYQTRKSTFLRH